MEKLRRAGDELHGHRAGQPGLPGKPCRLAAAGPEFSCSCPYEFGGLCKHGVALGLAVLDTYKASELEPSPGPTPR
ncbi:MAG: hypothetical protein WKG07_48525 [Hymenobacter sp.]